MWFKEVKKANEIVLPGVKTEVEFHNGYPHSVTLTSGDHVLKICQGPYSSLNVFVPEPPKMIKRWVLSGQLTDGITIENTVFDDENRARERKMELEKMFFDSVLTVEEIEIPEDSEVV